jgi:hypothetical protein
MMLYMVPFGQNSIICYIWFVTITFRSDEEERGKKQQLTTYNLQRTVLNHNTHTHTHKVPQERQNLQRTELNHNTHTHKVVQYSTVQYSRRRRRKEYAEEERKKTSSRHHESLDIGK